MIFLFVFSVSVSMLTMLNYVLAVMVWQEPWLMLIFSILEFAVYFFLMYMRSTDRYLMFQPKHFSKQIQEDMQREHSRIRRELSENLRTVQTDFIKRIQREINEAVPELQASIDENLKLLEDEFQNDLKSLANLKEEHQDVLVRLDESKAEMVQRFEISITALYRDFYEFKYPRQKEARTDLKRMQSKLDGISQRLD